MTKLSILMACLSFRDSRELVDKLLRQSEGLPVEVLTETDSGEATSGVKRQRLTERSSGEYIAFVDDDDDVSPRYVESILDGCNRGADVVSIALKMLGRRRNEIWQFGLHADDRRGGRMAANHLCAWRREIAQRVAWCPELGYADDQLWYKPIHAAGLARTEHRIADSIYIYDNRLHATQNQTSERIRFSRRYFRLGQGLRCFRDSGGELFIETACLRGETFVRDRKNIVKAITPEELTHYATVKMA